MNWREESCSVLMEPRHVSPACLADWHGSQHWGAAGRSGEPPCLLSCLSQRSDTEDGACRKSSCLVFGNKQAASTAFLQSAATRMANVCTSPFSFLLGLIQVLSLAYPFSFLHLLRVWCMIFTFLLPSHRQFWGQGLKPLVKIKIFGDKLTTRIKYS